MQYAYFGSEAGDIERNRHLSPRAFCVEALGDIILSRTNPFQSFPSTRFPCEFWQWRTSTVCTMFTGLSRGLLKGIRWKPWCLQAIF
ncbi:MAG: hypothetical protein DMG27_18365 [Acidobacteria bacterium]|nr:MAG: hypothetical protein DMG27_18365 [Acidobacteriota bacterium]